MPTAMRGETLEMSFKSILHRNNPIRWSYDWTPRIIFVHDSAGLLDYGTYTIKYSSIATDDYCWFTAPSIMNPWHFVTIIQVPPCNWNSHTFAIFHAVTLPWWHCSHVQGQGGGLECFQWQDSRMSSIYGMYIIGKNISSTPCGEDWSGFDSSHKLPGLLLMHQLECHFKLWSSSIKNTIIWKLPTPPEPIHFQLSSRLFLYPAILLYVLQEISHSSVMITYFTNDLNHLSFKINSKFLSSWG